MAKSKTWNIWDLVLEIHRDFFQYGLVTYLILLLMETVWEKNVSYRFNLNNLLIAVIVSGLIMVFSQESREGRKIASEITKS